MGSPQLQNDDAKQHKKRNYLVVVIVILTLLNGYFAFNHWTTKKKTDHLESKRQEIDSIYAATLAELDKTDRQLDSLKGKNNKLDELLANREKEITERKKMIEELMLKNDITLLDLNAAKKMVQTLKNDNFKFKDDINLLNDQIAILTQQRDSLYASLEETNLALEAMLEQQKSLEEKVLIGALLKPENIVGTGIRSRSNGSETETNIAKKAEKLKICFDIPENRTQPAGNREIYVRLLHPSGVTLAIESQGSGSILDKESNAPMQYTLSARFDYNGMKKNICVTWAQSTNFTNGSYKVLLYQDGYFLTEGSFVLK